METETKPFSRILVADDLQRENKADPGIELKLASSIAEPLHSEIRLVHTYKVPELTVPAEAMSLIEGPFVEAMTEALDEEAEAVTQQKPQLKIVPRLEKGDPVHTILNDIKELGCELAVVGTHARHGMRRAVLGSVAEEIIRLSPVPVLSVNPHTDIKQGYRPTRILVPLDMSETGTRVTEAAARFAKAFSAQLVLANVIEEWVYPVVQSASLLAGGFVMPLERDLQELANLRDTQLREILAPIVAGGVQAQVKLIERAASVGGAIVDEAKSGGYDLIIMGHRHASRIEYAVLGSVSRYVIREAHCPVLTVPPLAVPAKRRAS